MNKDIVPYVVPLVVVAILFFRMRRMPARPVNMTSLWIVPLLASIGIGMGLWFTPHPAFGPAAYAIMAGALVLGVGIGLLRARTLSLRRCPETGRVLMETSMITFALLVALLLVRSAVRSMTGSLGAIAIDASMLFALGMVVTQRLAIWQRVRAMPQISATS